MAIIDDVTALLGFPEEKPNRTLDVIIRLTTNRLKTLLDVEKVPTELEYIVTDVAIVDITRLVLKESQVIPLKEKPCHSVTMISRGI